MFEGRRGEAHSPAYDEVPDDGRAGTQPRSTLAGVYRSASAPLSARLVGLDTAPGPRLPHSKKRALEGSYQILAPVESTDDIRSHPLARM